MLQVPYFRNLVSGRSDHGNDFRDAHGFFAIRRLFRRCGGSLRQYGRLQRQQNRQRQEKTQQFHSGDQILRFHDVSLTLCFLYLM